MSETTEAQEDGLTEAGENPEAAPSVTFAGLDEIAFKRGAADSLFRIELDGLPFTFRLRRKRKSGKLLVVLNGTAYRSPPSFGRSGATPASPGSTSWPCATPLLCWRRTSGSAASWASATVIRSPR